ncbi:peptide chain release factor N(5)-glutamine methyltransferase [Roseibacillus ishigakijimensis]|uniref:Release factor glutamine methyltransferase n=1 Tax=Roseibacillus ishigakijimensis TaxID=454146 RepID=A0A934VMA8_9BACT|nr:peptide chain release factor N(5)-glutamine methyltransferase [Roseibacillus ishigakijimensis]
MIFREKRALNPAHFAIDLPPAIGQLAGVTTVLEVIDGGTAYLEKRGVAEARLNMQRLVGHHLDLSRVQLYLEFDRPLEEDELAPIRESLRQRGQGIPLQHLIGEVEFMGLDFKCDARALIPRPETEELVSLILQEKETLARPSRVLDVGTGSGVIGLSLAHHLPAVSEVVLADLSPEALSLARENAQALDLPATFCESDLFSEIEGTFDLIVANLPYVPERDRESLAPELQHDPALALFSGPDGMDLVRKFCAEVADYLNPGGLLAMEVGHDQGAATAALLARFPFTDIDTKADLSKVSRFPFARRS